MPPWKDTILPKVSRGVRDLVIGVAGSIIAAIIAGLVSYSIGYDAGYNKGLISGAAASAAASVNAAREEFDKKIKAEEEAHKVHLKELTEETKKNINDIISKQYGDTLLLQFNQGRNLGETTGYASGLKFGEKECEQSCQNRIEDLKGYSQFWEGYTTKIHEYFKATTETEMRSRAEGIVNIAMQGRASLKAMAEQLNTFIEQIDTALKAGDLKRVQELMRALEGTLPQKSEIWYRNFKIITGPVS